MSRTHDPGGKWTFKLVEVTFILFFFLSESVLPINGSLRSKCLLPRMDTRLSNSNIPSSHLRTPSLKMSPYLSWIIHVCCYNFNSFYNARGYLRIFLSYKRIGRASIGLIYCWLERPLHRAISLDYEGRHDRGLDVLLLLVLRDLKRDHGSSKGTRCWTI